MTVHFLFHWPSERVVVVVVVVVVVLLVASRCWNINSERNNLFGMSLILHLYFINGQLYISAVRWVHDYHGFPTGHVLYFRYMDLPCGCAWGFPMWNSLVFPTTWFCHVLRGRHREIGLRSIFPPFLVTHVFPSRASGG